MNRKVYLKFNIKYVFFKMGVRIKYSFLYVKIYLKFFIYMNKVLIINENVCKKENGVVVNDNLFLKFLRNISKCR